MAVVYKVHVDFFLLKMAALHPELVRQNVEHTELLGPLSKKQQYNNYLNNISFYNIKVVQRLLIYEKCSNYFIPLDIYLGSSNYSVNKNISVCLA